MGDCQNDIFGSTIKIVVCKNLPWVGHELVEIVHLDQLCWVSKT